MGKIYQVPDPVAVAQLAEQEKTTKEVARAKSEAERTNELLEQMIFWLKAIGA